MSSLTDIEDRIRSLLNDPNVACLRNTESVGERYAPPPKLLCFEHINGEVIAKIENTAVGGTVRMALDCFGRLSPRHSFA